MIQSALLATGWQTGTSAAASDHVLFPPKPRSPRICCQSSSPLSSRTFTDRSPLRVEALDSCSHSCPISGVTSSGVFWYVVERSSEVNASRIPEIRRVDPAVVDLSICAPFGFREYLSGVCGLIHPPCHLLSHDPIESAVGMKINFIH
jgi:hypothetical protein